jgi:hypothetical protein
MEKTRISRKKKEKSKKEAPELPRLTVGRLGTLCFAEPRAAAFVARPLTAWLNIGHILWWTVIISGLVLHRTSCGEIGKEM